MITLRRQPKHAQSLIFSLRLLVSMTLSLFAETSWAQVPPTLPEQSGQPWQGQVLPDALPPIDEHPRKEVRSPLHVLPSLPGKGSTKSVGASFLLREVRLRGNIVLSDAELQEVIAPYLNRRTTTSTLFEIRNALTRTYVRRGYISSGASIPDQTPQDGIVWIELVEGRLSEIQVLDGTRLRTSFITRRLRLEMNETLDIRKIERRLRILQETAQLAQVDARIEPGPSPGKDRLVLKLSDNPVAWVDSKAGTLISPSLGGLAGSAGFGLVSPAGLGDSGRIGIIFAEGLFDLSGTYSIPITSRDLTFNVHGRFAQSKVVADPVKRFDIRSRFVSAGVGLSQPIWRERNQRVDVGLIAEWREGRSYLGEDRIGFSDGTASGLFRVTALRFFARGQIQNERQIVSVQSTWTVGIDALGATVQPFGIEDGRFFSWLGQIQWLRQFERWPLDLLVRANAQVADDPLLPIERFSVGGRNSVRGYRESLFVRDNGATGSIELRWPIKRDGIGRRVFEVFVHADAGHSWNSKRPNNESDTIAGAGLGFRYSPKPWIGIEMSWTAHLVKRPKVLENDIQDEGVFIRVWVGRF